MSEANTTSSPKKVTVAVLGMIGTGKHTIIDRQIGFAEGLTHYEHVYDPLGDYVYDRGIPYDVGRERVHVEWHCFQIHYLSGLVPQTINPPRELSTEQKEHTEMALDCGRWTIRECDVCVLVYSVQCLYAFQVLPKFWDEIYTKQLANQPVPIYSWERPIQYKCKQVWVVASKIDLSKSIWKVSLPKGKKLAAQIGAQFRAVSGRTGEGCEGFALDIATSFFSAEGRKWDLDNFVEDKPSRAKSILEMVFCFRSSRKSVKLASGKR